MRKPDVGPYRQVTFFDGRKVKDMHPQTTAMKPRIDSREGRLLYSRRLGIVEPVFGNLHTHRLRRFTLRSRRKVDAQWKLFAIVHNIQKLQGKALGKARSAQYRHDRRQDQQWSRVMPEHFLSIQSAFEALDQSGERRRVLFLQPR